MNGLFVSRMWRTCCDAPFCTSSSPIMYVIRRSLMCLFMAGHRINRANRRYNHVPTKRQTHHLQMDSLLQISPSNMEYTTLLVYVFSESICALCSLIAARYQMISMTLAANESYTFHRFPKTSRSSSPLSSFRRARTVDCSS